MNPLLQESKSQEVDNKVDCPLWFFYNAATNQCECYNRIPNFNGPDPTAIKCVGQRVLINLLR